MLVVGIDPGQTGGWALIDGASCRVGAFPADCWWRDLDSVISCNVADRAHFFLEAVSSMPKQGVASTFKFGRNFGIIEGMLIALGARFEMVRPQAWQKAMHAGIEKSLDAKARSLIAAQRLFPGLSFVPDRCRVPHSGMVDALLIAEYGRRKLSGLL